MLGDSTAAGYGVDRPDDTPAALLSSALAAHIGRPVLLSNVAFIGGRSERLDAQIDRLLADGTPQVAGIIVGANDVTHRNPIARSAGQFGEAVARLTGLGCDVVVATCPDLGTDPADPAPAALAGPPLEPAARKGCRPAP